MNALLIPPPVGMSVTGKKGSKGIVIALDPTDADAVHVAWEDAEPHWHTTDQLDWKGKIKNTIPTGSVIAENGGQYVSIKANGDGTTTESIVSNFAFTPLRALSVDGDDARTVFVAMANGSEVQVPSRLFGAVTKFKDWCHGRGLEWTGTQRDLDGVFALLNRADVERLQGVTWVGLHERSFVFPDQVIGEQGVYAWVPPAIGDVWTEHTNLIEDHNWDVQAAELVASLHRPDVITPRDGVVCCGTVEIALP
jgi:hypothetical protein